MKTWRRNSYSEKGNVKSGFIITSTIVTNILILYWKFIPNLAPSLKKSIFYLTQTVYVIYESNHHTLSQLGNLDMDRRGPW